MSHRQTNSMRHIFFYLSIKASIPGNFFPSKNSREAPPPVEICVILSSSPAFLTAAAESPPPITVIASGNSEIAARNGGAVYLNDGIFSTSGYQGHAVIAEENSTVYINSGSFSSSGAKSIVVYANGGTIIVENISSISANGKKFGVDNGGQILISKTYSATAPTSLASGCIATDNGDGYWLITKN